MSPCIWRYRNVFIIIIILLLLLLLLLLLFKYLFYHLGKKFHIFAPRCIMLFISHNSGPHMLIVKQNLSIVF